MIKSPLRYPGGKSRALTQIAAHIPAFDEYREPFVGGGSVFIYLKQLYPQRRFWINDLYPQLFHFWQYAQQNLNALIQQVTEWKTQFTDGKQLFRFLTDAMPQFTPLQTAAAFFVFNRITFSGTTEAGGFSQQAFSHRFTQSSIDRLAQLSRTMNDVTITNLDYSLLTDAPGNNVFVFLDPPYYSATQSALYGKNGSLHKIFDHRRFAETMKNCPHKWLITYDNSPFIKELFSFACITEWNLMYGMRNQTQTSNQLGSELFISNYPLFS
ncbi:DNA adenine methylase [Sphingobacteriales bacterium UPWRP_1]|nr:modification methylase [Sphingobacteriales bacterium TSM_CSS]PSJ71471.1 DNA adenine methylase [Sphingobacteriales bacterium UPWRP_1]